MNNYFCLDSVYSTTRMVVREEPVIIKASDFDIHSFVFAPRNSRRKGEGGLRTKGYFKASYPGKPLITVITVVFNGAASLEETINSVIKQRYDNVEYIIIDGNSTDTTVDIINKYDDQIDYWISEPDDGIYQAMNKALALANGIWLYFLGADDQLLNIPIPALNTTQDLIIGLVQINDERYFHSTFGKRLLYRNTVHHQGAFYKASAIKQFRYSTKYRVMSDYLLNLTLYKKGFCALTVDSPVSRFGIAGASSGITGKIEWLTIVFHENGLFWLIPALFIVVGGEIKRKINGVN